MWLVARSACATAGLACFGGRWDAGFAPTAAGRPRSDQRLQTGRKFGIAWPTAGLPWTGTIRRRSCGKDAPLLTRQGPKDTGKISPPGRTTQRVTATTRLPSTLPAARGARCIIAALCPPSTNPRAASGDEPRTCAAAGAPSPVIPFRTMLAPSSFAWDSISRWEAGIGGKGRRSVPGGRRGTDRGRMRSRPRGPRGESRGT